MCVNFFELSSFVLFLLFNPLEQYPMVSSSLSLFLMYRESFLVIENQILVNVCSSLLHGFLYEIVNIIFIFFSNYNNYYCFNISNLIIIMKKIVIIVVPLRFVQEQLTCLLTLHCKSLIKLILLISTYWEGLMLQYYTNLYSILASISNSSCKLPYKHAVYKTII